MVSIFIIFFRRIILRLIWWLLLLLSSGEQHILRSEDDRGLAYALSLTPDGHVRARSTLRNSMAGTTVVPDLVSNAAVDRHTWTFVALSFNGRDLRLYVEHVLDMLELHWDVPPASVMLSITGGAQDFMLPPNSPQP